MAAQVVLPAVRCRPAEGALASRLHPRHVSGELHHIGTGRDHARTPVLMLVRDLHVRVINAAAGELICELAIDPARNYQPTGKLEDQPASSASPTRHPRRL